MNHASLFTGIGGFDLAARWMGWNNVFQVEIDEFCHKVLNKNFPETDKHKDIYEFDGTQYTGEIDILTGGFPCQPFSTAGKRMGESDDRYLWPEMLRVIREVQPTWVVGENVAGILSMEGELRRWENDLEGIGFEVQTFDIPAYSVGLQTMERHIWIIAKAVEVRRKRSKKNQNSICRTAGKFQGTNTERDFRRHISETRFCRVGERVSSRVERNQRNRIAALGNAIPPPVAYEIFRAIEAN